MTRSLGDIDCSDEVVPHPHIRQLEVPRAGLRCVLASDGLWDCLHAPAKALKQCRDLCTSAAAERLLRTGTPHAWPQTVPQLSARPSLKHVGSCICLACQALRMRQNLAPVLSGWAHLGTLPCVRGCGPAHLSAAREGKPLAVTIRAHGVL